jgi:hypothetical protein
MARLGLRAEDLPKPRRKSIGTPIDERDVGALQAVLRAREKKRSWSAGRSRARGR